MNLALAEVDRQAYPYFFSLGGYLYERGEADLQERRFQMRSGVIKEATNSQGESFFLFLTLVYIRQVLRRLIESRFPRPAIIPSLLLAN